MVAAAAKKSPKTLLPGTENLRDERRERTADSRLSRIQYGKIVRNCLARDVYVASRIVDGDAVGFVVTDAAKIRAKDQRGDSGRVRINLRHERVKAAAKAVLKCIRRGKIRGTWK